MKNEGQSARRRQSEKRGVKEQTLSRQRGMIRLRLIYTSTPWRGVSLMMSHLDFKDQEISHHSADVMKNLTSRIKDDTQTHLYVPAEGADYLQTPQMLFSSLDNKDKRRRRSWSGHTSKTDKKHLDVAS